MVSARTSAIGLEEETLKTDVLIIGSGGAGLFAAVRAAQTGMHTTVLDKSLIARSGATVTAEEIAATGPWSLEGDGPDTHFRDTLLGGKFLNNQELVRLMVHEVKNRIRELEEMGLYFDKDSSGRYKLDVGGGHSYRRLLEVSNRVGLQIGKVLWKRAIQLGVEFKSYTHPTRIITHFGTVKGVVAINHSSGVLQFISAKSIVLATGGIGQVYPITSNPRSSTGDGLALALEAGSRLINMEQVQFYPACAIYPEPLRGYVVGILEHSKLYNSQMERFMGRYQPGDFEHTTRDILARSIFNEISEGRGTQHGGVYLDARDVPESLFRESYAHEYETCLRWGVDLLHQLAEVAPGAHYFMGGVEINERCETPVQGLYAAGEVSAGLQGANRLNGNSLSELVVFGAIAGEQAATYATSHNSEFIPNQQLNEERARIIGLLARRYEPDKSIKNAELRDEVRAAMWRGANVIRTINGLEQTLKKLASIRSGMREIGFESTEIRWNNEFRDYLELESMLTVAELVTRSALARKESRGAHFLSDFPIQDDERWLKNTVAVKMDNEVRLTSSNPNGVEVIVGQ